MCKRHDTYCEKSSTPYIFVVTVEQEYVHQISKCFFVDFVLQARMTHFADFVKISFRPILTYVGTMLLQSAPRTHISRKQICSEF